MLFNTSLMSWGILENIWRKFVSYQFSNENEWETWKFSQTSLEPLPVFRAQHYSNWIEHWDWCQDQRLWAMRTGWEIRSIRPENAGCWNAVLNANLKYWEGDLFFFQHNCVNWTSGCEWQLKEKQFRIDTRNHFSIQIICRYELLQGWRKNRIIKKNPNHTKLMSYRTGLLLIH